MELTYKQAGDYLIPDLELPENPRVGKFGMLRQTFLREHRSPIYTGMLFSGKLNPHLEEIDRQANEMLDRLICQMKKEQGVTEAMKAENQLLWVQRMNNIRNAAEEIVLNELVYKYDKEHSADMLIFIQPHLSPLYIRGALRKRR